MKKSEKIKALKYLKSKSEKTKNRVIKSRWFIFVVWIVLFIVTFCFMQSVDSGYFSPEIIVVGATISGAISSYLYYIHTAERYWPILSTHLDKESIERHIKGLEEN